MPKLCIVYPRSKRQLDQFGICEYSGRKPYVLAGLVVGGRFRIIAAHLVYYAALELGLKDWLELIQAAYEAANVTLPDAGKLQQLELFTDLLRTDIESGLSRDAESYQK